MPRHADPPRLALDRKGSGYWYVYHHDGGRQRERSTGTRDRGRAQEFFEDWLAARRRGERPGDPAEFLIAEALARYGAEHAPTTRSAARIGQCMEALLPYWGELPVAAIGGGTARRYVELRRRQIAAAKTAKAAAAWQRWADRRAGARSGPAGRPRARPEPVLPQAIGEGTPRKELAVLQAAIGFCAREGYLTQPRQVWKPAKPPTGDRWLSRREVARLLLACRHTAPHLARFILLSIRTGHRREAVLGLRWTASTAGGWVDLAQRRLYFNAIGRAETKKRRRTVPIGGRLLWWLQRWHAGRRGDHVIGWQGGAAGSIKRSWRSAFARAGLEYAPPHVLKHTAITWMCQSGRASLVEIGDYTGTSIETMTRVYRHHHPDHMAGALAAVR